MYEASLQSYKKTIIGVVYTNFMNLSSYISSVHHWKYFYANIYIMLLIVINVLKCTAHIL